MVQVSSNGNVNCPNEPAVFICSGKFVNWNILPGVGFQQLHVANSIFDEFNNETMVIKSVELVFRFIYKNESFIAVQLTIPTPIPLIGSTINCNNESIQVIMTRKISTFNSQIK